MLATARRMLTSDSIITRSRLQAAASIRHTPGHRIRRQRQVEAFARRLVEVRFQASQGAGA
jgi:hypothetical protein